MTRTVCFLLLPRVHLMDLAGPAQVFYEATQIGPAKYNVVFCGVQPETSSEQGLILGGLSDFEDVKLVSGDFVFVPGIDFLAFKKGVFRKDVLKIKNWLSKQLANGIQVASICSGSLILADAGVLNGKSCTSHWKCIDYLRERYPKVDVQTDRLFVKDGNIYTSAGMTSGIDMALNIIETYHGPIAAAKVAREIVVYMRRNEDDKQQTIYLDYKTHFNPAIHKVQDYIISHPRNNATLEELADIGNISVRNLTRMFKQATGHTIIEFKNAVRIELASTLLHNPEFTIEKIALSCGFQNARQLRRIWSKHKGTTLSEERRS
ncbi:MAG TPA: DJ-1/PfpI family protein [Cyclobacteriaceae bacterium]|nr:DJ-1/PfpI family protein [Cyclobacteriaceae bacterium]